MISSLRPPARLRAQDGLPLLHRPVPRDLLLAFLLTPSVVPLVLDRADSVLFWWELIGAVLLVHLAVHVSRTSPPASLLIAAVLSILNVWLSVTLLVMSYLAGRRMSSPRGALLSFAAVLAVGSLVNLVVLDELWSWFTTVAALPLVMVFPWVVGRYVRLRDELTVGGWQRARQLEREQDLLSQQARMRERARIAQDMHDSLGHELTLISLQAGALEVQTDLSEKHRAAVVQLREAAAAAAENLRDTIGMLHNAAEEPLGQDMDELVDRARASGVRVELRRQGEADLSKVADLAARRVVLESLTNAAKHAPDSEVRVEVTHREVDTEVRVTNGPPPGGPAPAAVGGSFGLVGLHERLVLAGGSLEAGPTPDGGFAVVAVLPHEGPSGGGGVAVSTAAGPLPVAERELRKARSRARYGLVFTVSALTTGVLIAVVASVVLVYQTLHSVLKPTDFEELRVGQDQAAVERSLPAYEYRQGRRNVSETEPPAGSACRYYRSTTDMFAPSDIYRLCFADGRLVARNAFSPSDD
ncbi:sensor histidine kinase [Streptomyces parvus]|uniref:sensor histidine kinase n=1 Tax=Streptomyces parvus TaxID=66428 RepID=UPI003323D093